MREAHALSSVQLVVRDAMEQAGPLKITMAKVQRLTSLYPKTKSNGNP